MNEDTLKSWLATKRADLKDAVKIAVSLHVEKLKSQYKDLYGYAILPGEPYEVNSLVAVFNRESEVKENSAYYRYSVDEWENWDQDALASVTPLIDKLNERFRSLHTSDPESFEMDEYEIAHISCFHSTFLSALQELNDENVFDIGGENFVAIWISDSDHDIIFKSVCAMNSDKIVKEFMDEFGG